MYILLDHYSYQLVVNLLTVDLILCLNSKLLIITKIIIISSEVL